MKTISILIITLTHATWAVIYHPKHSLNIGLQIPEQKCLNPLQVTLNDRTDCEEGDVQPPNRHNTTERVNQLIEGMKKRNYAAYIVPTSDEHQNEYVAESDQRRQYISGFTGSAGTAVILANGSRALWTDGRYFLQADQQLDCNWLLMKEGLEGVPSISEWLIASLKKDDVVSADARLIGADTWISFQNSLEANKIFAVMDEIQNGNDLLDEQWNNDGRPLIVRNEIFVHEIQYNGKAWQDKVNDVILEMKSNGADVFVVTALDEIAWLLNIRGSDIPYTPVFQSYAIIDISKGSKNVYLFIDGNLTSEAYQQLGINQCGSKDPCVSLFSNNDIGESLININDEPRVRTIMIPSVFSYSLGSSFYVFNLISNGEKWTEMEAAEALAEYRYIQEDNMGLSFETISAFGANGAIIHYTATPETDTLITDQNLFLLDSGGHYKDGSTDVTRTVHFGTPTPEQIEAYTRVLIGVIDFATTIVPQNTAKSYIDITARRALYEVGMDYRHGTSHGIGVFLFIHESSDIVFELGFCGSDEPGYYEDGQFGIRIENVVMCVEVETKYNFTEVSYGFETLTLVPFEPKLIDFSLLNKNQCKFIDEYNTKIRETVGPLLAVQNLEGYRYMLKKTDYSCT